MKHILLLFIMTALWAGIGASADEFKLPVMKSAADAAAGQTKAAAYETDANDYHIGPLDLLEIKVLQAPDMARSVRVDSRGNISLPLIGVLRAAGLTSLELEQAIAAKLSEDMIRDPQVSVFIKEFTSQRVTVQGVVKKPGVYDFQGRATLLQAISMGGGLDEKANENRVKVIRRQSGTAVADETIIFDLEVIRKSGSPDPILKGGDIVVVEEAVPITVEGQVIKPGIFYQRGKATLMQLISQAGGLSELADASGIKVFSANESGQKVTFVYDLEHIRDGKLGDPVVRPGDVVVVEKSTGKSILYGITNTLRGFVGFGTIR